jgi:hypothetical protein
MNAPSPFNSPAVRTEQFPAYLSDARKIVTVLSELIEPPRSVVDVGGNVGAWCKAFKEQGTEKVLCIDHPGVSKETLLIDPSEFRAWDFARGVPEPVLCDLAICLEVVEHVNEPTGEAIVDFLTRSASLVLFSAAVSGQPGWGHINNQPHAYWKDLFARHGFDRLDIVRPKIIGDPAIPFWYRQNLYLFASAAGRSKVRIAHIPFDTIPDDFELIHARLLEEYRNPSSRRNLGQSIRSLWDTLCESITYRAGRMKARPPPRSGSGT